MNGAEKRKLLLLAAALGLFNVVAWLWALATFRHIPALLGTAAVAYGLGLRHAVDADHIAAIDNVTRRLRETGRRPATVGLFFSLGHSSVVLLATLGIVLSAGLFGERFAQIERFGGTVGTLVSSGFLFVIASVNVVILVDTFRRLRVVRREEAGLPPIVTGDGPLSRLLRPVFWLVEHSWHMFPIGFLFGLGFDTASEVGLLGLSAAEAARGLPLWSISQMNANRAIAA